MSRVPLSDEETRVIFTEEVATNLAALDKTDRTAVISRLINIVTNDAPPSSFVHESVGDLDIIKTGKQGRLYTKVVDGIPGGNAEYHIVFLFYLDTTHEYRRADLAEYTTAAAQKLSEATQLETVSDVETYLRDNDALDATDLQELIQ